MDILNSLNENQREAVLATEGPMLILAGAGSGKTRVITHRIAHIINEKKANPWQIFAVTFTNKAAEEMKERLASLAGDKGKAVFAKTFHSASVYILRRFGEAIGIPKNFSIYDTADQAALIKSVMNEMKLDTKRIKPSAIASRISSIKDKADFLLGMDMGLLINDGIFLEIYNEYQNRMATSNALDFNDLLIRTVELLRRSPETLEALQRQWRYFLVDEYQDTNYAQYVIARMLASETKNICVVGDDDQSIYSWRGADIRNILNFEKDYGDTKVVTLEENYRSTEQIIRAAAALIENNIERKQKTVRSVKGLGAPIVRYQADNEYDEAQFAINKIVSLKLKEGFANKDFAIFYRTNAQSRSFEMQLRMESLPYRVIGGQKFYDRKEIKDIIAYMKAAVNPDDEVSLLRIINVPPRGIGHATIDKLRNKAAAYGVSLWSVLESSEELPKNLNEFKSFMTATMEAAGQIPPQKKLSEFTKELIERSGYRESLSLDKATALSRNENIDELINSVYDYEQMYPEALLGDFLQDISLMTSEDMPDENGGVSDKADAVTLMTVHTAKGLEFPVVFLTGLEENTFPHKLSIDSEKEIEEERRLCYVGITRAGQILFITNAEMRSSYSGADYKRPSRFLDEIPKELVEYVEPGGRYGEYGFKGGIRPSIGTFGSVSSRELRMSEAEDSRREENTEDKASVWDKGGTSGSDFKPLDRVMHPKYGKGIILSVEGSGDNIKLNIAFGPSKKSFLEKYTPLKKL